MRLWWSSLTGANLKWNLEPSEYVNILVISTQIFHKFKWLKILSNMNSGAPNFDKKTIITIFFYETQTIILR